MCANVLRRSIHCPVLLDLAAAADLSHLAWYGDCKRNALGERQHVNSLSSSIVRRCWISLQPHSYPTSILALAKLVRGCEPLNLAT